jgi:ribosome-binding protein aMBF1 (putative translation factor)
MSNKKVALDKKDIGYLYSLMSPEQCRAARAWLDWSQQDLAKRANVGLSTLKDFESGNRTPIANNLASIERALTEARVEFLTGPDGRPCGLRVDAAPR